jgi:hypothetical protein
MVLLEECCARQNGSSLQHWMEFAFEVGEMSRCRFVVREWGVCLDSVAVQEIEVLTASKG